MNPLVEVRNTLKKHWGYDQFRPFQEEIILSILAGNDTLALLPTGGGKSICFQIPAIMRSGLTVVISPLIALMKDQVYHLRNKGINAAALYSGLDKGQMSAILDNAENGHYRLLYISPERLMSASFALRLPYLNISLIAVDEAHCISQWGYDFRPEYLQIASIRKELNDCPIIALTATATPSVVQDIMDKLEFKKANLFQSTFERKNLQYHVIQTQDKRSQLLKFFMSIPGSSLVYVKSRIRTVEVADFLKANGIIADHYHAGLTPNQREKKQDAWISGKLQTMVCTNAFGMGIDKSDVRFVIHTDAPESLEAYFQEAGRAGRDGKSSYGIWLWNDLDIEKLHRLHLQAFPSIQQLKNTYEALGNYLNIPVGNGEDLSWDFDLGEFCKSYDKNTFEALSAIRILSEEGYIHISEALNNPAKLIFKVSHDYLYEYLLKNKDLDHIVKALLRMYQGIMSNAIHFDEVKFCEFLKMESATVRIQLRRLQLDDVITYNAPKSLPQITYLMDRFRAEHLKFDLQRIEQNKKIKLEKIKSVETYLHTNKCRSMQLCTYFGDTNTSECGHCDVCRALKASKTPVNSYDQIVQLLQLRALNHQEICSMLPQYNEPEINKALDWLMKERIIDILMNGQIVLRD